MANDTGKPNPNDYASDDTSVKKRYASSGIMDKLGSIFSADSNTSPPVEKTAMPAAPAIDLKAALSAPTAPQGTSAPDDYTDAADDSSDDTTPAPPVKSVASRIGYSVTGDAPELSDYKPETDGDGKEFYQKTLSKVSMLANELPEKQKSKFEAELASIQDTFKEAKSSLEWREMADTFADGLTKLAAGAIGLKTGTDMSTIKLEKHDYSKDLANLHTELQVQLGDLRSRREESQKAEEFAQSQDLAKAGLGLHAAEAASQRDLGLRSSKTAEDANKLRAREQEIEMAKASAEAQYHNGLLDVYGVKQDMKAHNDFNRDVAHKVKAAEDYQKQASTAGTHIRSILDDKKQDPDAKIGLIANVMTTQLGVPASEAHKIAATPGMLYGENLTDTGDIMAKLSTIVEREYKIRTLQASKPAPDMVLVVKPSADPKVQGQYGYMKKSAAIPSGYKVIPDRTMAMPSADTPDQLPAE